MTSVQLKDLKGKAVGEVTLDEQLFDIEPNTHVLHQALIRQLSNARAGTACTKTRAEVRGGGKKPWRQKGTGRARAGSIRSPLWAGGGVTFGPKPRDYTKSMPRKARVLAMRSAVAARREDFVVVKNFDGLFASPPAEGKEIDQPKTRAFAAVLKDLGLAGRKVLLILDSGTPGFPQIEKAARNIDGVRVLDVRNLNVKDLLAADHVLTSERTVVALNQRFRARGQAGSPAGTRHGGVKERKVKKVAATSEQPGKPTAARAKKEANPAPAKAKPEPRASKVGKSGEKQAAGKATGKDSGKQG